MLLNNNPPQSAPREQQQPHGQISIKPRPMEVCCGFFGFDAGDAIEEDNAEENPFTPQEPHKPKKQKHPLGVARHKPAHHKAHHRVIPKHHHAARASTVAKGNGTRDHCALPKPTGVAWDGLTAMMPITDPQWEKDFMERLDRIESSDQWSSLV